jgi:hypothetical protein
VLAWVQKFLKRMKTNDRNRWIGFAWLNLDVKASWRGQQLQLPAAFAPSCVPVANRDMMKFQELRKLKEVISSKPKNICIINTITNFTPCKKS